jgi:hypothetical protein
VENRTAAGVRAGRSLIDAADAVEIPIVC